MSTLFTTSGVYGNATLYFDPDGRLGTPNPTGPNLVRWMMAGRATLTTVNGSNLTTSPTAGYGGGFASAARFLTGNAFTGGQAAALTRIGVRAHLTKMNMLYPT
jgi:hypothetical protein